MLYNAAISLYRAGVKAAALCGHRKAALLDRGQRAGKARLCDAFEPGDRVVWVHAASLGEFEQGRPLMELIRRRLPDRKILLTFFSPSGYEVRKDWQGADVVCYLPFDTPGRVRRFLDAAHPEMAIFVKYEIWRNYLRELHRRGIPAYLISAAFRPEHKFFKRGYGWYASWLRLFTHLYVQDELSRRLLAGIGIDGVTVAGDTRFDRVADIRSSRKPIAALEALRSERVLLMAGSSWPADEDLYIPWVNAHPEVDLVIAPHEFDAKRLAALKGRFAPGEAVLLSEAPAAPGATRARVAIIDCFGLLSSAYAYADIAYVGGGFGAGIHNINEPAVYDIPVVYGPNNGRFVEAGEMAAAGGGFPVADGAELTATLTRLLDAPTRKAAGTAAGAYIRSRLGATRRIADELF